jgi:hypothetical protein
MRFKYSDFTKFDLLKLNWIGWFLLLGSAILAATGAILIGFLTHGLFLEVLSIVPLAAAVGFFFGCRWVSKQVGVSIYRPDKTGTAN